MKVFILINNSYTPKLSACKISNIYINKKHIRIDILYCMQYDSLWIHGFVSLTDATPNNPSAESD